MATVSDDVWELLREEVLAKQRVWDEEVRALCGCGPYVAAGRLNAYCKRVYDEDGFCKYTKPSDGCHAVSRSFDRFFPDFVATHLADPEGPEKSVADWVQYLRDHHGASPDININTSPSVYAAAGFYNRQVNRGTKRPMVFFPIGDHRRAPPSAGHRRNNEERDASSASSESVSRASTPASAVRSATATTHDTASEHSSSLHSTLTPSSSEATLESHRTDMLSAEDVSTASTNSGLSSTPSSESATSTVSLAECLNDTAAPIPPAQAAEYVRSWLHAHMDSMPVDSELSAGEQLSDSVQGRSALQQWQQSLLVGGPDSPVAEERDPSRAPNTRLLDTDDVHSLQSVFPCGHAAASSPRWALSWLASQTPLANDEDEPFHEVEGAPQLYPLDGDHTAPTVASAFEQHGPEGVLATAHMPQPSSSSPGLKALLLVHKEAEVRGREEDSADVAAWDEAMATRHLACTWSSAELLRVLKVCESNISLIADHYRVADIKVDDEEEDCSDGIGRDRGTCGLRCEDGSSAAHHEPFNDPSRSACRLLHLHLWRRRFPHPLWTYVVGHFAADSSVTTAELDTLLEQMCRVHFPRLAQFPHDVRGDVCEFATEEELTDEAMYPVLLKTMRRYHRRDPDPTSLPSEHPPPPPPFFTGVCDTVDSMLQLCHEELAALRPHLYAARRASFKRLFGTEAAATLPA